VGFICEAYSEATALFPQTIANEADGVQSTQLFQAELQNAAVQE
jgi:hypothetical protein